MSASFRRLLRVPFTTKRAPDLGPGRYGEPEIHLAGDHLRCTPIDPADGQAARELSLRLKDILDGPYRIVESFVSADHDIQLGDILIARGREYTVRQINRWEWDEDEVYLHLLFEDPLQ